MSVRRLKNSFNRFERIKVIQNLAKKAEEAKKELPIEFRHLDDSFSITTKYFEVFGRDLEPDVIVEEEKVLDE